MARARIKYDAYTREYRVTSPDKTESGAYYTNDLQDAIGTAAHMHGVDTEVVFNGKVLFCTFRQG